MSRYLSRWVPISPLALCVAALSTSPGLCGEPTWSEFPPQSVVAVTTREGRVVRGRIDPRSDDRFLWLVAEAEGIVVASRLTDAQIVRVEPSAAPTLPPRWSDTQPHDGSDSPQTLPQAVPAEVVPPADSSRVKSLAVFAHLENWDDDPQPDGLRLYVVPRSDRGELVRTAGTVTARLAVYRGNWRGSRGRFGNEETWSRPIGRNDFGPHGAVVDLPFRNLQPEQDGEILPLAVLDVRLGVPGQGTFDTRLEDVELRSGAFTRDLRLRNEPRQAPGTAW